MFRLKDEIIIVSLIDQVLNNYEKMGLSPEPLCRVYLLRIEHTYYKLDVNILKSIQKQIKQSEDKRAQTAIEESGQGEAPSATIETTATTTAAATTTTEGATTETTAPVNSSVTESKPAEVKPDEADAELINRLCKFIYTNGSDRIRTRAMLCHIFHHAKHDRWYEARDLMLISHLQETIQHSDIPTQVSFFLRRLDVC